MEAIVRSSLVCFLEDYSDSEQKVPHVFDMCTKYSDQYKEMANWCGFLSFYFFKYILPNENTQALKQKSFLH